MAEIPMYEKRHTENEIKKVQDIPSAADRS
jgi:hypothetical protein